MEKPTIGIDLGASYTKVAYRGPLIRYKANKFAEMETDIVLVDGSATVPSLMIKTRDRRMPWIIGADAAGTNPGKGMEVFENWKSALYSSEFDAAKVKLVTLAGRFFEWLSTRLSGCGVDLSDNCRVRVTIPGLTRIEDRKEALIECMRLHGWPDEIEVVIEPVANLVGVLSGGRNYVSAEGRMHYWMTIGDGETTNELGHVFKEMRKVALGHRTKRNMQVCVVDFGSFTLDVAKLRLDLEVIKHEAFPVEDIIEESWEVGVIELLDRQCLQKVLANNGIDEKRISFTEKELAKVTLYGGDAYALGRNVILGESETDKELLDEAINAYCTKAWERISKYCRGAELVVLTGGGICIPRVQEFVNDMLARSSVPNIASFTTDAETRTPQNRDNRVCTWQSSGEGLGRLATCLGAASIGFGFQPDDACKKYVRT